MAIYYDSFEIAIKINNKDFGDDASKFSFTMTDSIHSLFSTCTFNFKDITGLMQEYLMDIEGFSYEVIYGFKDETISNKYVVTDSNLSELLSSRYFSGSIDVNLIHDYYNFQEIKSESYKNDISSIIRQLLNTYTGFNSINISPTQCNTFFIQPLMTDSKFITDILLPNSYSKDSNESPFFCFIDSNNNFNFKYYKELLSDSVNPVATINYTNETNNKPDRNTILDIKRITPGATVHKKLRNRFVFQQSQDDGSLIENTDNIKSYPNNNKPSNKLPIIKNENMSGHIYLFNEETNDVGLKECYQGQKINSMKESMFTERLIITLPLNTNLISGKVVELNIPSPLSKTNDEKSIIWGGKYLIEKSSHIWNGNEKNGYTQLIISKKYITVANNNYLLTDNLT